MDMNELFLTLAIIILVAVLLLLIYKVGLSAKSFDEAIEEQKLDQLSLTDKSKLDGKKDRKTKKLFKKKSGDKTETEDDFGNNDEIFDSLDFKELGSVTKTAAGKNKKVAKENKGDVVNTRTVFNEKNSGKVSAVPLDSSKTTTVKDLGTTRSTVVKHVTIATGSIVSAHTTAVKSAVTSTSSSSVKVASEAVEKSVRVTSERSEKAVIVTSDVIERSSPVTAVRSTDTGPSHTDVKLKKHKDVEQSSVEHDKLVAASAPLIVSNEVRQDHSKTSLNEQVKKARGKEADVITDITDGSSSEKFNKKSLSSAASDKRGVAQEQNKESLGTESNNVTTDEWITRGQKGDVSVSVVKKQLDEKDAELRILQSQLQASNAKYNEVRQEVLNINQRYATLDKTSKQQLLAKEQETENLKSCLAQVREQHRVEVNKLSVQLNNVSSSMSSNMSPSTESQVQLIMQLSEENRQLKDAMLKVQQSNVLSGPTPHQAEDLKQQLKFMDDALKQNSKLLNTSENNRKSLEVKLKQQEDNLKHLEQKLREIENKSDKRVSELKEELKKSQEQNKTVSSNEELKACQTRLQEKEQRTNELESEMKVLQSKFVQLQQVSDTKDQQLYTLQMESERQSSVSDDLSRAVQEISRLQQVIQDNTTQQQTTINNLTVLQSAPSHNGDENELCADQSELSSYKEQLEIMAAALNDKTQQLETTLQQSVTDKLNNSRSSEIVLELERELERYKTDLTQLQQSTAVDSLLVCQKCASSNSSLNNNKTTDEAQDTDIDAETYKSEIERLKESERQRVEEIRRLTEVLNRLRLSHDQLIEEQEKVKELSSQQQQQASDNSSHREELSAELSVQVTEYKQSLERLEREVRDKTEQLNTLTDQLNTMTTSHNDLSSRLQSHSKDVATLHVLNGHQQHKSDDDVNKESSVDDDVSEREKKRLQSEIKRYQGILYDTEEILKRLQENVESEEQNWQQKLLKAQVQLDDYTTTIQQLQQQLEESRSETTRLIYHRNLTNGFSPAIEHIEPRLRKTGKTVVFHRDFEQQGD